MPKPTEPNLELEAHLRELDILLELLTTIIELRICGMKEPLSETATWLIYEAQQRSGKANAIYHGHSEDDVDE